MKRAFDDDDDVTSRGGHGGPPHPFHVHAWYGRPYSYDPPPPLKPPDDKHQRGDIAARLAPKDPAVLERVGVVLGRFRPPHRGHELLVEEAFARCGWLHIVSPWALSETRGHHYAAFVHTFSSYGSLHNPLHPPPNAGDPAAWAEIVYNLDPRPTHLFSSDQGAAPLAHKLGIEHVLIDPQRVRMPISATAIRDDLASHFAWLAPAARPHYAFSVGIIGAEGSGKTTLMRELQTLFRAAVVEEELRKEAARCNASGGIPSAAVFVRLMKEAPLRLNEALREAEHGIVITDNDAVSIYTWAQRVGHVLPGEWQSWSSQNEHRHLWLLCHNDFPFSGARERDEPEKRRAYVDDLRRKLRWAGGSNNLVEITGEGQQRVEVAAHAIREQMAAHMKRVMAGLSP